jgi:hypothetical protein
VCVCGGGGGGDRQAGQRRRRRQDNGLLLLQDLVEGRGAALHVWGLILLSADSAWQRSCSPSLSGFGAADTASNRTAMSWQELLPHLGAGAGESSGVAQSCWSWATCGLQTDNRLNTGGLQTDYRQSPEATSCSANDAVCRRRVIWRMLSVLCLSPPGHAGDYLTVIIMQYCSFGTLLGAIEVGEGSCQCSSYLPF